MAVPELATARLLLRPRVEAHMPDMLDMAADPEVMRYFRTRPGDDPDAYPAELLRQVRSEDGPGLGYWSIYARAAPDRYLGWLSLTMLEETVFHHLGYRLVRDAWGRGYVAEGARAVLQYGFATLGLEEIVAVVHPDNLRSQASISRLGFSEAGTRMHFGGERLFYRLARPE